MRLSYSGQRVLVLGGSSSLGLALVDLLLTQGLKVIPTYCSSQGQKRIAARFPDLKAISLDFFDQASVEQFPTLLGTSPDYLIDLAHADYEGLLAAANMSQAEAYFTAHVTRRLAIVKTLVRSMMSTGFGRLVHVSSVAASCPGPGQGFYASAKRAAESFYLSMGVELGSRGITSVSVRLGLVDAGRGKVFLDNKGYRQQLAHKVVTITQARHTLCFLLSDQALGLACTTLTLDAGLTAIKYADILEK